MEMYSAAAILELPPTPAPAPIMPPAYAGERPIRGRRPRGVTVLAVLTFVAIIPTVSLGFFLLSYAASARAEGAIPLMRLLMWLFPILATNQQEIVSQTSQAANVMFVMAGICGVLGYGLWTLRKWGRILAIVCSALTVLHATGMIFTSSGTLLWHLLAIALNIWIITYLLKPHVKQAFGA